VPIPPCLSQPPFITLEHDVSIKGLPCAWTPYPYRELRPSIEASGGSPTVTCREREAVDNKRGKLFRGAESRVGNHAPIERAWSVAATASKYHYASKQQRQCARRR
jgi:hypothetical protein